MKKEEIIFILKEVSFDDDAMKVLSLRPEGTEIAFPLDEGPINFSVLFYRGLSERWGVRIRGKGDAYIYRRDAKDAEKVSLHASGKHHISVTDETAVRIGASNRFGPQWIEQEFGDGMLPTFSVLFPPWGVADKRPEDLAKKKGELLVVGHMEKIVVVGFFIIDSRRKLRVNAPHLILGKLALRPGKILYVVTWKEPEGGLLDLLRASLKQVRVPSTKADNIIVSFEGFRAPHSAFMVTVPAVVLR